MKGEGYLELENGISLQRATDLLWKKSARELTSPFITLQYVVKWSALEERI